MATVVCCGAATLDTIFRVERMPTGPGKILPTAMIEVAHGMATSAAAAVARLGGRARLFARVGDDARRPALRPRPRPRPASTAATSAGSPAPARRSAPCWSMTPASGWSCPSTTPPSAATPAGCRSTTCAHADAALVDVRWPEGAAAVLDAARAAGIPAILDADVGPRDTMLGARRRAPATWSSPSRPRSRSAAPPTSPRRSRSSRRRSTAFSRSPPAPPAATGSTAPAGPSRTCRRPPVRRSTPSPPATSSTAPSRWRSPKAPPCRAPSPSPTPPPR